MINKLVSSCMRLSRRKSDTALIFPLVIFIITQLSTSAREFYSKPSKQSAIFIQIHIWSSSPAKYFINFSIMAITTWSILESAVCIRYVRSTKTVSIDGKWCWSNVLIQEISLWQIRLLGSWFRLPMNKIQSTFSTKLSISQKNLSKIQRKEISSRKDSSL